MAIKCGRTQVSIRTSGRAAIAALLLFVVVGCGGGGSVDQVNITPRTPAPSGTQFIVNLDLQGASVINPSSASRRLSIHSVGRSTVRTSSTSSTFRMSSGIGVD